MIFAPHAIDFYKTGHLAQYPLNTNQIFSNFTPRSAKRFTGGELYDNKVVVLGIQQFCQAFLIDSWNRSFFNVPKQRAVNRYKRRMDKSLGTDAVTVDHLEALHDLGYLPITLFALPEGSLSPIGVPVLVVFATDDKFAWVTNYIETAMSTDLWKVMTTATIAREYRKLFNKWADITGADKGFVVFQGHDFSARGLSCHQDGYQNGIGHLTSFLGTDTVLAIDAVEDHYSPDDDDIIGTSVAATEHSVMSMNSKEKEMDTYRRLLTEVYPSGIVSIVSDTWDYWNVLTNIIPALKNEIINRKENEWGLAKAVIRPDSGNPIDIICGTVKEYFLSDEEAIEHFNLMDFAYEKGETHILRCYINDMPHEVKRTDDGYIRVGELSEDEFSPAEKGSLNLLWEVFGGTINEKGYKVLHPRIGLIYGDSITLTRAKEILTQMERMGFASTNIVFGIGSFTYQYITRDTLGFAMKATYGEVNGVGCEIFKDPITDDGTKKSAKGLIAVFKNEEGEYYLKDQCTWEEFYSEENCLKPVFKNSRMIEKNKQTWTEIKNRLWS